MCPLQANALDTDMNPFLQLSSLGWQLVQNANPVFRNVDEEIWTQNNQSKKMLWKYSKYIEWPTANANRCNY